MKDASCEDSTSNFGNKWMALYLGECHKISIFTFYFILLLFPTFLKRSCCRERSSRYPLETPGRETEREADTGRKDRHGRPEAGGQEWVRSGEGRRTSGIERGSSMKATQWLIQWRYREGVIVPSTWNLKKMCIFLSFVSASAPMNHNNNYNTWDLPSAYSAWRLQYRLWTMREGPRLTSVLQNYKHDAR